MITNKTFLTRYQRMLYSVKYTWKRAYTTRNKTVLDLITFSSNFGRLGFTPDKVRHVLFDSDSIDNWCYLSLIDWYQQVFSSVKQIYIAPKMCFQSPGVLLQPQINLHRARGDIMWNIIARDLAPGGDLIGWHVLTGAEGHVVSFGEIDNYCT